MLATAGILYDIELPPSPIANLVLGVDASSAALSEPTTPELDDAALASATVPALGPALPPLVSDSRAADASRNAKARDLGDIPGRAVVAYKSAATIVDEEIPACNLSWTLVAAIGLIETDHARYGGSKLDPVTGVAEPPIYGPQLTGAGDFAFIGDSDDGRIDKDKDYDRAVGPMQFIPKTWVTNQSDGDGDGQRNPQDIDDAALATSRYLCGWGWDLASSANRQAAVHAYNQSAEYVNTVLGVATQYAAGNYDAVPVLLPYPMPLPTPSPTPSPSPSASPSASPSPSKPPTKSPSKSPSKSPEPANTQQASTSAPTG